MCDDECGLSLDFAFYVLRVGNHVIELDNNINNITHPSLVDLCQVVSDILVCSLAGHEAAGAVLG